MVLYLDAEEKIGRIVETLQKCYRFSSTDEAFFGDIGIHLVAEGKSSS